MPLADDQPPKAFGAALTSELQARRAATRENRTFNVQRPIFTV